MAKIPLNITVDKDILDKFKHVCDNNDIKISTKINTLMKEWIEKNGN
jgi:antitoxin component of RelBE/YafQ-DinJ toxin-antitoxin module